MLARRMQITKATKNHGVHNAFLFVIVVQT
jgi:hypothetical protein